MIRTAALAALLAAAATSCSTGGGAAIDPVEYEIVFLDDPHETSEISLALGDNLPPGTFGPAIVIEHEWEVSAGMLYWDREFTMQSHGFLPEFDPPGEWTTKMRLSESYRPVWVLPLQPGEHWVRVRNLNLGSKDWLTAKYLTIE